MISAFMTPRQDQVLSTLQRDLSPAVSHRGPFRTLFSQGVSPTEDAPVVILLSGKPMVRGLKYAKTGVPAEHRSIGRRCLVPVSRFQLSGPDALWLEAQDESWFMAGGILRPTNQHGEEAVEFAFLSVPSGADLAHVTGREPILVEPTMWSSWLNPSKDTRRLHVSSPSGTFAAAVRRAAMLPAEEIAFH